VLGPACKGKAADKTPPAAAKPAQPTDAAAGKKVKPIDPAKRAEYQKRLKAGRALAGDKKWRDAASEFAAALEAIPMDGRALSELGWAAFQAGDFDRAREANRKSVLASSDSSVKAASLYNLGRVAEATGDGDTAGRHYRESLKLRDNETVRQRLAKVGAPAFEDWRVDRENLPCRKPMPIKALCSCIKKARAADYQGGDFSCEPDVDDPDASAYGVLVTTHGFGDIYLQLIGRSGAGWSVAAELEYAYNPGAFGIFEELADDLLVDEREVGGTKVLWIEAVKFRTDRDMGLNEEESVESTKLTVCKIDAKTGVTCIFQAPIAETYTRDRHLLDDEAEAGVVHTKGLPIKRSGQLAAKLSDSGVLSVTLESGQKTSWLAPYIGEHKLW